MPTTERSVNWLRHAEHEAVFCDRDKLYAEWLKSPGLPSPRSCLGRRGELAPRLAPRRPASPPKRTAGPLRLRRIRRTRRSP